jgi:hypothetical protein
MAHHQKRSYFVALFAGTAGLFGACVAYLCLGAATGVVNMCSGWAPRWWMQIYICLAALIPAVAVWAAALSRRAYLWRRGEVSDPGQRIREAMPSGSDHR